MPRGFLVKRNSKAVPVSYRSRNAEDEGLDDVFVPAAAPSETFDTTIDIYAKPFNSPDSGYGHSPGPVAPLAKENFTFRFDKESASSPVPVDSPLSTSSYPSPVPFSSSSPTTFEQDRFLLTTPTPRTPHNKFNPTAPPPIPGKRPYAERVDRKQKAKKPKAARRLNFDEDELNKSPVHGTIIRDDLPIGNGRPDEGNKKSDEFAIGSADTNKDKSKTILGGEYICKLCNEQYPDPLSLAQHKCSRIVHEVYRCPECDKVFNCPANLASHRRWHKPRPNKTSTQQNSNSRILPATPTNKDSGDLQHSDQSSDGTSVISSLSGSESSRSTPSPGSQTPNTDGHFYHCDQCGKKFRRPANLRKHMQTHAENSTTYSCQYCGQTFNNLTSRAKHMLTHTTPTSMTNNISPGAGSIPSPPTPREVACHICGGTFENKDAMEHHLRLHHVSEVFACKFCPSIFPSSSGLTRHINKEHPSENRHVLLLQMPSVQHQP